MELTKQRSAEEDGTQAIADALAPPSLDELFERAYQRGQTRLWELLDRRLFDDEPR